MSKQTDKKLTLKRETLRELTKAELRLVAGGGKPWVGPCGSSRQDTTGGSIYCR